MLFRNLRTESKDGLAMLRNKICLTKNLQIILIIFYDFAHFIYCVFFHPCLVLSGGFFGFIRIGMGAEKE
jgi:hypothetical protein